MGHIKVDTSIKDIMWYNTNLSNIETIKGLMKFRIEFDLLYERNDSILNLTTSYQDLTDMSDEVICLYIDLDNCIKNCGLTKTQKFIIDLYMKGMSVTDIADKLECYSSNITGIINSACKRILKYNNFLWKYEFIYIDKKYVDFDYKQCSKCKKHKPAIEEFFSPKDDTKDKFHPYCKQCRINVSN